LNSVNLLHSMQIHGHDLHPVHATDHRAPWDGQILHPVQDRSVLGQNGREPVIQCKFATNSEDSAVARVG